MMPPGMIEFMASRRVVYAVLGGLLGLGAPVGLIVVRSLAAGQLTPRWIRLELLGDAVTFTYVGVSTVVVFATFGSLLGAQVDRLEDQAQTDVLTGLLNRRAVQARLDQEIARARRHGHALSLLLIDVDHLKEVNDRAGHRGGDLALKQTAAALVGGSRAVDVCGRWGGDEFVVLAPSTTGADARHLAERIRALAGGGGAQDPTVSIGVSTLGADGAKGASALVNDADAALYRAKQRGRNRVVAFDEPEVSEP